MPSASIIVAYGSIRDRIARSVAARRLSSSASNGPSAGNPACDRASAITPALLTSPADGLAGGGAHWVESIGRAFHHINPR